VRKRLEELQGKRKKVESESEDEDEEESDVEMREEAGPSKRKGKATNLIPTGAPNEDEEEGDGDDDNEENVDEEEDEEEQDESSTTPITSTIPRILLTTSPHPTTRTHLFLRDLLSIFPGGEIRKRPRGRGFELGRIARWAAKEERGYDCLIVVNEDHKIPSECCAGFTVGIEDGEELVVLMKPLIGGIDAITIINLPAGPTAYFKLTSVQLGKEIYGHARPSPHSRTSCHLSTLCIARRGKAESKSHLSHQSMSFNPNQPNSSSTTFKPCSVSLSVVSSALCSLLSLCSEEDRSLRCIIREISCSLEDIGGYFFSGTFSR
jgi:rRNA maturation protein Rpf1